MLSLRNSRRVEAEDAHLGRPVDREERHDHAVVAESPGGGDGILSFERRRELVGAKTHQ